MSGTMRKPPTRFPWRDGQPAHTQVHQLQHNTNRWCFPSIFQTKQQYCSCTLDPPVFHESSLSSERKPPAVFFNAGVSLAWHRGFSRDSCHHTQQHVGRKPLPEENYGTRISLLIFTLHFTPNCRWSFFVSGPKFTWENSAGTVDDPAFVFVCNFAQN